MAKNAMQLEKIFGSFLGRSESIPEDSYFFDELSPSFLLTCLLKSVL